MEEVKVLIPRGKIRKKVKELASSIKRDFKESVYCVVVLTGAIVFFSDLMRELKALDMVIEFSPIKVSSYSGKDTTGRINVELDLKEEVKGKEVLIVEDIIDRGLTLNFLKEHLKKKGAEKVKIVTLLDKSERRTHPIDIDYVGFEIPDKFVVGYGIDYDQKYRDLDYIGYID